MVGTVTSGTAAFVYDLEGLSQQMASGSTTYEVRDNSGTLLAERTPSGSYYLISDTLGSTIALTDAQGALVSTWAYDPWGEVISSTGSATTSFLFAGGFLDQPTGLYKMGTRYYDPIVGRWTQTDPEPGCLRDPLSLNRFAYVDDDPANETDPSGRVQVGKGGGVSGGGSGDCDQRINHLCSIDGILACAAACVNFGGFAGFACAVVCGLIALGSCDCARRHICHNQGCPNLGIIA